MPPPHAAAEEIEPAERARIGSGGPPALVAAAIPTGLTASACGSAVDTLGGTSGGTASAPGAGNTASAGGTPDTGAGTGAGAGTGTQPGIDTPPAPTPLPFELADASRLLGQAGFGATRAEIVRTRAMGAAAWIDEQIAMPRGPSHVDWLKERGFDAASFSSSRLQVNHTLWRAFLTRPDQLRQRMVYALSQVLVVGINGVNTPWPNFAVAYYVDLLDTHALGSFRALLEAVTLSPAMGAYLSMRGSRKADASGRQPDENYAREILQLFTIGLLELAPDGTPRLGAGAPVETYDADDVSQLARAFTGWDLASGAGIDTTTPQRLTMPMQHYPAFHETGTKAFLGTTIPAGTSGPQSLSRALDTIVAHPNVGPFIARQLIQRLVVANPSPAYVGRVAAAFADDGTGVRGNLAAVARAILLDVEARSRPTAAGVGKLREPVLRFTQWARACGVTSPTGAWNLGSTADPATRLGQSPLQSASVFNFYRPGYVPPNTALAAAGLVSPEMQIATETSVAGYLNFMQVAIASTTTLAGSELRPDYAAWLELVTSPDALVAEFDLVLAAGALSATTRTTIAGALAAMPVGTAAQRLNRVRAAVLLVMACPEYLVQK
jgi:uncharacterized protein (DUF1800 family)